jgi:hypothetical protein
MHYLHFLGPMARFDIANIQGLKIGLQPVPLHVLEMPRRIPSRVYAKLRFFETISYLATNATLKKFHETNDLYGD